MGGADSVEKEPLAGALLPETKSNAVAILSVCPGVSSNRATNLTLPRCVYVNLFLDLHLDLYLDLARRG